MCNLYRLTRPAEAIAKLFDVLGHDLQVIPGNVPEEVYPGYPGLVVTSEAVRPMVWGFPLALTGAKGQPLKPRPVNNARTDKLTGPFWSASFRARRCLIPVSAFAEAEGEKGFKTRCWFSLPDAPLMAVAGFWRPTAEWGNAYTMVMTSANVAIGCLHDRMPVILPPHAWQQWLHGEPDDALALCQPYAGDITVDSTSVPWAGKR